MQTRDGVRGRLDEKLNKRALFPRNEQRYRRNVVQGGVTLHHHRRVRRPPPPPPPPVIAKRQKNPLFSQ